MDEQSQFLVQLMVVACAAAIVARIAGAGLWRPAAMADAPDRPVGLGGVGLAVGIFIYMLGTLTVAGLSMAADSANMPSLMHPDELSPRQYAVWMLVGQTLTTGIVAAAFAGIAVMKRGHGGLRDAGFVPRVGDKTLRTAGIGAVVALVLVFAVNIVVTFVAAQFGYETDELGHDMLIVFYQATSDPPALALLWLSAVAIAPITEEIVFRGLVQSELLSMIGSAERRAVIIIASALFMAIHMGVAQWQTWPGLFTLALVLGWLYERYGNLAVCIVVHMAFNAANLTLMFVFRIGETAT
jgi:membrane protease YdiL (CAAX protease family)